MTLDEFFQKLEQTPRDWILDRGTIRQLHETYVDEGRHCPLSACAGTTPCHVEAAQLVLGLGPRDAEAIEKAADNYQECDQKLRKRLLKACGL